MGRLFKKISCNNINEYFQSMDKCILNLSSIYYILDSYKIIRKNPEEGITLLNAQLDGISKNIEGEMSYQLFCELIGAEFSIGDKSEEIIPLFQLIKGIKESSFPYYPWQSLESNYLFYEDEVELSFINDLEKTKNKTVGLNQFLFEFEFDKTFLSIISEMKKFPRSREILNIYQNILLMKDFVINENSIKDFEYHFGEEDQKIEFFNFFKEKIKEASQKGENLFENVPVRCFRKLDNNCSEKDKDELLKYVFETPKVLFLAHFYAAGLNLSEKLSLKTISEIDEQNFKKLQIKLVKFSQHLLTIKNKFGATLDEVNNYCNYGNLKEKDLNILIKDVMTFFENRDFDFIKNKFPTSRELASMRPGGPGILKRINKFESLNSFKKYFFEYLKNLKEKKYRDSYINPNKTITTTDAEQIVKKNSEIQKLHTKIRKLETKIKKLNTKYKLKT